MMTRISGMTRKGLLHRWWSTIIRECTTAGVKVTVEEVVEVSPITGIIITIVMVIKIVKDSLSRVEVIIIIVRTKDRVRDRIIVARTGISNSNKNRSCVINSDRLKRMSVER